MPNLLKTISIRYRLMAVFSILFILITTLAAVNIFSTVRETLEQHIESELKTSANGIKSTVQVTANVSIRNSLRAIAEKNLDILSGLNERVKAGDLSEAEARDLAKFIFSRQVVGDSGYVYVLTSKGLLVHHPAEELIGKDLSDIWLGLSQTKQLEGYLEYDWINPGEDEARPKVLFMAYFEPWDWIVSVSAYHNEFLSLMDINDFRPAVDSYAIDKSGYAFIIDTDGNIVIHPWLQGNVNNLQDVEGKNIFKILTEKSEGQFTYWWYDPNTTVSRQKMVLFRYIPELRWIVASTSYVDETHRPLRDLRNTLLIVNIFIVLLILPISYWLGASIATPLRKLSKSMAVARHGDLSVRADIVGYGELIEMAENFNQYMDRLEEFNFELKDEISERIKVEGQLELFSLVFHNTLEGICITNKDGLIININPAFTNITGYGIEEVRGKNPRILKSGHHDEEFYVQMWDSLAAKGSWEGEIWNKRKNGEIFPELLSIISIHNEYGKTVNYVGVFHDTSDIKNKDKQIEHQAYHDALTGLPNRTLAQDRLMVAMTNAKREGDKVVLLFLDLDNFKKINDSLGHQTGDLLIKKVAQRLRNQFQDASTVARLGGDEFLIIVEHAATEHGAVALADRLLKIFQKPFELRNQEMSITPSIGVTLYPDDGDTPEVMIKNADMAMYQSKNKGKNSYSLFTQAMNKRISKRIQLENDIHQALKNQEFTVFFQPKVATSTAAITGLEALVRWQRQDGTIVSPAEFIPLAEENGQIMQIGEYVLESSCKAMQVFDGLGYKNLTVAVNLSPVQFEQEDLVEKVMTSLRRNGLDPNKLELEVTESALMTDIGSSIEKLNHLSAYGISIAIDDFGTGYSSLYYLKKFPISVLKIDRSFIMDITQEISDAQIVETIIMMAKGLGLKVVAEGVETRAQLELLKTFECEMIQGFYYSRPLPIEDVIVYFQEHNVPTNIAEQK